LPGVDIVISKHLPHRIDILDRAKLERLMHVRDNCAAPAHRHRCCPRDIDPEVNFLDNSLPQQLSMTFRPSRTNYLRQRRDANRRLRKPSFGNARRPCSARRRPATTGPDARPGMRWETSRKSRE
jgi:hypothetical protein